MYQGSHQKLLALFADMSAKRGGGTPLKLFFLGGGGKELLADIYWNFSFQKPIIFICEKKLEVWINISRKCRKFEKDATAYVSFYINANSLTLNRDLTLNIMSSKCYKSSPFYFSEVSFITKKRVASWFFTALCRITYRSDQLLFCLGQF